MLGVFAALAVLALAVSPRLAFDADPLDTKNPNTEAMRTLRDLMNSPLTNPYSIDILTPNVADAAALAEKLRKLPTAAQVITLESFVPDDQQQKLALIADANSILAPTLLAPSCGRAGDARADPPRGEDRAGADRSGARQAASRSSAGRDRRRSEAAGRRRRTRC